MLKGIASISVGTLTSLLYNKMKKNKQQKQLEEQKEKQGQQTNQTNQEIKFDDIQTIKLKKVQSSIRFQRISVSQNIEQKDRSCLLDELNFLASPTCEITAPNHQAWDLDIQDTFPVILSPIVGNSSYRSVYGGEGFLPEDSFVFYNSFVVSHSQFSPAFDFSQAKRWLRGGPRKNLFLHPKEQKALIIVGGGVVPSSNALVRELVMTLHYNYNVKSIFGMPFGLQGSQLQWRQLGPDQVKYIHNQPGAFMGVSPPYIQYTNQDIDAFIIRLKQQSVTQLYLIGGLHEHKLLNQIYQKIKQQKLQIGLCGLPQTLDSEYPIFDQTVGFDSGVEGGQQVISQCCLESRAIPNGLMIIQFGGQSSGHMPVAAALASRDVDVCLVPEFPIQLQGTTGLLQYVYNKLVHNSSCVIVVSEGVVDTLLDYRYEEACHEQDVSQILATELEKYCSQKGMKINLQQVNPQFQLRSKQPSTQDIKLACQMAQNGVHGVMAGFTNFSVGLVNNKTALVPIEEVISGHYPIVLQPQDQAWQRLLALTGQPSFLQDQSLLLAQSPRKISRKQSIQ